jgi:saccharopine dehydrogenase (NAD+, L-lysine-forming)
MTTGGFPLSTLLGIRREDKNRWERRVPIIPEHVQFYKKNLDIHTVVQPSSIRAYSNQDYLDSGATVQEDLSECPTVFAVKEIPQDFFQAGATYVFFSHTVKGQRYNMPMLKKMMDLGCNLIDYEKIADKQGRRLVFFGRFAGLAGMIDSLWSYGKRLQAHHITTPLQDMKQTVHYRDLQDAKQHVKGIGDRIKKDGLPSSVTPLVVGITGYGNVSKGAQEILDPLPRKEVSPEELPKLGKSASSHHIYKVVFKEKDMVAPLSPNQQFDLQEYYHHPERYQGRFEKHVPYLSVLVNCIYWEPRYPRLITKDYIKEAYTPSMKLQVIGDISIDINGSIEFTEKATNPDMPTFVYNPLTDSVRDGVDGPGIVVMAVDNLPCELPRESSEAFSKTLLAFVPVIAKADYSKTFQECKLTPEIKKAVILYHGEFTENYCYIDKYL